jgi:uncharacterized protein YaaQ
MKLIIAVVQKDDASVLSSTLIENGFYVTKLSTTGGFLKIGNVTLLIGAKESEIEEIKSIIKNICKSRKQIVSAPVTYSYTEGADVTCDVSVKVGGATLFVLDVDEFEKF